MKSHCVAMLLKPKGVSRRMTPISAGRNPFFLVLMAVLAGLVMAPGALAQSAAIYETFDFDTWVEGWKPTTNANWQGITNVCQTTNCVQFVTGANQLRIDCDLDNADPSKREGRALVDLQEFCPYATPLPMNLAGRYVSFQAELPAGSCGTDLTATNTWASFLWRTLTAMATTKASCRA